jgi:prepilin-type N-terminal cleavage/methylation domain-containing protein/prepilin-type processing-associated H-X9-DG protein
MTAPSVFTSPRKAGFTLIELLTVIAIIGILASILIPVVGRVRQSARTTTTLSNVRQIGALLIAYSNDNDDFWPAPALDGRFWHYDHLFPYLTGRQPTNWDQLEDSIFVSPSASPVGGTDGPGQPPIADQGNRSFGLNAGLPPTVGFGGERKRPGMVENPTRTMAVMDANSKQILPWDSFRPQFTDFVRNRHGGRNATLFVDGHVELVRHEDIPRVGAETYNTFWQGR